MRNALVAWLLVVAMLAPRNAFAQDEDNTVHVAAQFRTKRPVSQIRADACALTGEFQIDGHARTWDVWFGSQRCSALPPDVDSIPLHVHVLESTEETDLARTVTLDAMSDEISEPTLRRAVTSTGLALRDAHAIAPSATEQVQTPQQAAHHGHAQGAAIAVAATAGGIAVVAVVVIVVVVVVGIVAGFAALFSALGKGI